MLLLCELLGQDPFRHHRNELFPFIRGLLAETELPASWKTIGISTEGSGNDERFILDLDDEERRALASALSSDGISRIVFNESLSPLLAGFFRRLQPAAEIICIGDMDRPRQHELLTGTVRELLSFLDVKLASCSTLRPDGKLLDEVQPSFAREPLLQSKLPPLILPRVLLGAECAYRRPLTGNPFFDELDEEDVMRHRGCSFCIREPGSDLGFDCKTPAIDLAFKQIDGALACIHENRLLQDLHRGEEDPRFHFLVQGALAFQRLDVFLKRLCSSPRPPSAFLFSCRADELIAKRKIIEQWIPLLEEQEHAIHIWVMGVENFSTEENTRLNKGITPEQILAAARLAEELEAGHPTAFNFSRYGGFSFILFTPWSNLSDLKVNLRWARRVGISSRSFFLRSRLQLVEGTPISLLAARHGLTVEHFSEPYFDSGCIQSQHETELSWRFRSPTVSLVYRLASRLPPELRDLSQEPLYERVQETIRAHYEAGLDAFDAFEELLDLAGGDYNELDEEVTLRRLDERLAKHPSRRERRSHYLKTGKGSDRAESKGLVSACLVSDGTHGLELSEAIYCLDAHLAEHGGRIHGHALAAASRHLGEEAPQLRLSFESEQGESFRVIVEPRLPGRRYLAGSAAYGVGYASETPANTSSRRKILDGIGKLLRRASRKNLVK